MVPSLVAPGSRDLVSILTDEVLGSCVDGGWRPDRLRSRTSVRPARCGDCLTHCRVRGSKGVLEPLVV